MRPELAGRPAVRLAVELLQLIQSALFLAGPVARWTALLFPSGRDGCVGVTSTLRGTPALELYKSLEARSPTSRFPLRLPEAFSAYSPCRVADMRCVRGRLELVVEAGSTDQRIGLWLVTLAQGGLERECLSANLEIKLAVRDGQVVGEVIYQHGKLTVISRGKIALEVPAGADLAPPWRFPTKAGP